MERFIEFEQPVTVDELQQAIDVNNSNILILRYSKLTGTVKVRAMNKVSHREIRRAFQPHKVRKIHVQFPVDNI